MSHSSCAATRSCIFTLYTPNSTGSSLSLTLILGDGSPAFVFTSESPARPYIQLFNRRPLSAWDGEAVRRPQDPGLPRRKNQQVLGFSAHIQQSARALPRTGRALRFTPDGKAVLYTSDLTAYSNTYLVEVGEFDELPDLE